MSATGLKKCRRHFLSKRVHRCYVGMMLDPQKRDTCFTYLPEDQKIQINAMYLRGLRSVYEFKAGAASSTANNAHCEAGGWSWGCCLGFATATLAQESAAHCSRAWRRSWWYLRHLLLGLRDSCCQTSWMLSAGCCMRKSIQHY